MNREGPGRAGMSQEELVRIINGTEWLVQQFESGWACNREEFNRISALLIQEPQHAKNGSPEQMEWLKRNNEAYTIWLERFVLRNVLDKAFGLEKESKIRIFRNALQMAEEEPCH